MKTSVADVACGTPNAGQVFERARGENILRRIFRLIKFRWDQDNHDNDTTNQQNLNIHC